MPVINEFRDLVNTPKIKTKLITNKSMWLQLCTSMDVISDTELAIDAYQANDYKDDGMLYLAIYGLLQALFLQQDAAVNLCEVLNIKINIWEYEKLREIRTIRNNSVGHPTKINATKAKPITYAFVSRITMAQYGFQLITENANEKAVFTNINISQLIEEQNVYIKEIIKIATNKLRNEYAVG
ncbi:hypothetical protein ABDB91_08815 [Desulfoscipio sp. XC116]|uniref:hypothetical protein n=1 Tax=Desulfoscipio sp. XC116 TaxID=3144975 RepID=UPI00325AD9C7